MSEKFEPEMRNRVQAPEGDLISRDAGAYGAASCAFWLIEKFSPFGRLCAGVSDDPEIVLGPLVLRNGEAIQCSMTCHEDMTWSYYIQIGDTPFSGELNRWAFPEDLKAALASLPASQAQGEEGAHVSELVNAAWAHVEAFSVLEDSVQIAARARLEAALGHFNQVTCEEGRACPEGPHGVCCGCPADPAKPEPMGGYMGAMAVLHQGMRELTQKPAAPAPVSAGVDLESAIREAIDLLTERTQGSPARSASHNARLVLEAALRTPPPASADGEGGEG